MNDNFKLVEAVNDIGDLMSIIEKHPFAFIFMTLGLGIGILIDNEYVRNKEGK